MLKGLRHAPWPIVLLVASFISPSELSLFIAGLRLPLHRLVVIFLLPYALSRVFGSKNARPHAFDVLVLAHSGWTVIAYGLQGEGIAGAVFGGSLALESFGAYIVARATVRTEAEFRATISVLMLSVIAAGAIALPETLFGVHFAREMLMKLTGAVVPLAYESRMGLTRAYGTFNHPIHLGAYCASVVALVWFAMPRPGQRLITMSLILGCTLTAVSSAPMLGIFLQVALLIWDRITKPIPHRILLTVLAVFSGLFVISMMSSRSVFALIATGMVLDSWTGYYRLLIWDFGMDSVWTHPIFGIGLADWARLDWMATDTIDAFWLVVAMRTGLPGLAFLLLAIAMLFVAVARRSRRDRQARQWITAWTICVVAFSLVAVTVHLWTNLHAYYFFLLGLGGWLADPLRQRAKQPIMTMSPVAAVSAKPRKTFRDVAGSGAMSTPTLRRHWPAAPGEPIGAGGR